MPLPNSPAPAAQPAAGATAANPYGGTADNVGPKQSAAERDRRNTRTYPFRRPLSYPAGQEGSGQRSPRVLSCFLRPVGPGWCPPSPGPRRNQTKWASEVGGRTVSGRTGWIAPETG
ncbi:hypothetical protein B1H19_24100 [Streptomyces gilvosporeus]|uniref:Uncharacterized protein n=1 Tax=Streptomyces gilvosporeus TaxID=553510 RepID=A0A1V0TW07_9ACTN|nr:hypothetical protein B1H19_24100 [Streptomyces gilvosporeus]